MTGRRPSGEPATTHPTNEKRVFRYLLTGIAGKPPLCDATRWRMPKILRNRPFRVGWPGTAVGAGTSLLLAGWFLATASTTTLSAGPRQRARWRVGRQTSTPPWRLRARPSIGYCVTCHNARTKTAGLMLDGLDPPSVAERRRSVGEGRQEAARRHDAPAGRPAA